MVLEQLQRKLMREGRAVSAHDASESPPTPQRADDNFRNTTNTHDRFLTDK